MWLSYLGAVVEIWRLQAQFSTYHDFNVHLGGSVVEWLGCRGLVSNFTVVCHMHPTVKIRLGLFFFVGTNCKASQ